MDWRDILVIIRCQDDGNVREMCLADSMIDHYGNSIRSPQMDIMSRQNPMTGLWQNGGICRVSKLSNTHSIKLLASSPIPQSASLGLGGLSSSLPVFKLKLLLALPAVPLLLMLPGLMSETLLESLLLVLFTLSAYSGGASEGLVMDVRAVSGVVLRVGVGEGVISVDAEISTSSASRYHFLRLV